MVPTIIIIWAALLTVVMSKNTQNAHDNRRTILAEDGADDVSCGGQWFSPEMIRILSEEYAKFRFNRFYTGPAFRWLTWLRFDHQLSERWGADLMTKIAINVQCSFSSFSISHFQNK